MAVQRLVIATLAALGISVSQWVLAVAPGEYQLLYSSQPSRAAPLPLHSATLAGDVYIFVDGEDLSGVQRVDFSVDGHPLKTEKVVPYDFAGTAGDMSARPYNADGLSTGTHTVRAEVTTSDGVAILEAEITIDGPLNPPLEARLVYSTRSDRAFPSEFSGDVLFGEIYVLVEYSFEILEVNFYLDETALPVEDEPPYDLMGGTNSVANPLDLNSLAPGTHTVRSEIMLRNGTVYELSGTFVTNIVDDTAPVITPQWSVSANEHGWHNQAVTVTPECEDPESTVTSCAGETLFEEEGANQAAVLTASNLAGLSAEHTAVVNLDLTAPSLALSADFPPNASGWHKQPFSITSLCGDALSGIGSCPSDVVVSEEGTQTIALQASDLAGNSTQASIEVSLDLQKPVIQILPSVPPQPNGWYSQPVTFSFTCTDTLSGVASCPEPISFNNQGYRRTTSVTVTDLAGHSTVVPFSVNLDFEPPSVNFISHADGQLLTDTHPQFRVSVTDNLEIAELIVAYDSGLGQASCQAEGAEYSCQFSTPLPSGGTVALTATATDSAGHKSSHGISIALDTDDDGIADYLDGCLSTDPAEQPDANGCGASQRDSDNDGFTDAEEQLAGSDPYSDSDTPDIQVIEFSSTAGAMQAPGEDVQLYWKVQGPAQVRLENDVDEESLVNLPREGSVMLNPEITTRYTLIAEGDSQTESSVVEVKIVQPAPDSVWNTPVNQPVGEGVAGAPTLLEDGSSVLGNSGGQIALLDPSGHTAWEVSLDGLTLASPAVIENRIVIGVGSTTGLNQHSAGTLTALDLEGQPLWEFTPNGSVVAAPLESEDRQTVFLVTYSGWLHAVSVETGQERWSLQLTEDPLLSTPVFTASNTLLIKSEFGELISVNSENGDIANRVLWRGLLN